MNSPWELKCLSGMVRFSITAYYPAVCRARVWMCTSGVCMCICVCVSSFINHLSKTWRCNKDYFLFLIGFWVLDGKSIPWDLCLRNEQRGSHSLKAVPTSFANVTL